MDEFFDKPKREISLQAHILNANPGCKWDGKQHYKPNPCPICNKDKSDKGKKGKFGHPHGNMLVFKCFVCGEKGSIIDYKLLEMGITDTLNAPKQQRRDAALALYKQYGIAIPEQTTQKKSNKQKAVWIFEQGEKLTPNKTALAYATSRQIEGLGDTVIDLLVNSDLRYSEWSPKDQPPRPHLIAPAKSPKTNQIVTLQRITLDRKDWNGTGTNKPFLYNDTNKKKVGIFEIGQGDTTIIVESVSNAVCLAALGYRAVAIFSTSNIDLIPQIKAENKYLWLDRGAENIQEKACKKNGVLGLWFHGTEDNGYDINNLFSDYLKGEGLEALKERVENILSSANRNCPYIYKEEKETTAPTTNNNVENANQERFFENDNKTYINRFNRNTGGYESKEVCNFVMRFSEEVWDKNNDSYIFAKVTTNKRSKKIQLRGDELYNLAKFSEMIGRKARVNVKFSSRNELNDYIDYIEKKSTFAEKKMIDWLGRIPEQKSILIRESEALSETGIEKDIDLIGPPSKFQINIPNNLEDYWKDKITALHQIYGDQLWKILGWCVGTVFVDEIVRNWGAYPLIFLNGKTSCGKSTLARIVGKLFGSLIEGKNAELGMQNFRSTFTSGLRRAEKYRSLPLFLNEYQPSKKNNALVQSYYDREGYCRAKKDNTLDVLQGEINCSLGLISTRSIAGYEAEAVTNRLVTIDFTGIEKTKEAECIIDNFIGDNADIYLGSFLQLCLQLDADEIIRNIKFLRKNNHTKADSRIVLNYTIVQACFNAMAAKLGLTNLVSTELEIDQEIDLQAKRVDKASEARYFISTLKALVEKDPEKYIHVADLDDKNHVLYVRFNECCHYVQTEARRAGIDTLPDPSALLRSLIDLRSTNKEGKEVSICEIKKKNRKGKLDDIKHYFGNPDNRTQKRCMSIKLVEDEPNEVDEQQENAA